MVRVSAMNDNHANNRGEIVKKILLITAAVLLATPSAMTEPLVSGSEPGWGNKMSAKQRRQTGFDDVRTAQKHYVKPNAPTSGVPGYAFKLLTIRQNAVPGISTMKSQPFGVYASMQECDAARAAKIAELDAAELRQPHFLPGTQMVPTTRTDSNWGYSTTPGSSSGGGGHGWNYNQNPDGSGYGQGGGGWGYSSIGPSSQGGGQSSTTKTYAPSGPAETMSVTFCEPGIYASGLGSGPARDKIAKDLETTGTTGAPTQQTTLEVPPGFVQHWTAPRPFTRVVPGTPEVVEIISAGATDRELVFTLKPEGGQTNILLLNDDGEQVANLLVINPSQLHTSLQQGQDGWQIYHKDNPYYVAPKAKK